MQVSNVVAIRGNVAVMKCTLPTLTRANQFLITWLKDDPSEGRSIITTNSKYTLTYSGELHVRDVSVQDSTVRFYCQLSSKLTGERYFSQPGHIAVTGKTLLCLSGQHGFQTSNSLFATESETDLTPKIEYGSSNVRAQVGEAVDLICSAQGYPPPTYRLERNLRSLFYFSLRAGPQNRY